MASVLERAVTLTLLGWLAPLAFAQNIPLQNLSGEDFRDVAREFSANAIFANVAGAGTLGSTGHFEFGLLGGATQTPRTNALAPDANVPRVPNALAYARVALPFAVTAEVAYLPRLGNQSVSAASLAFALSVTPTEFVGDWPLDLSVRAQFARTDVRLRGEINQVRMDAAFAGQPGVAEVRASKNFGILTPYAGAGVAWSAARMNASGAAVFDPAFSREQRADVFVRSALINVGLELHFVLLAAGVEYQRAFATDRLTAKLGLGF